jgi:hypothetical protein
LGTFMRDDQGLDACDVGFLAFAADGAVSLSIVMPTCNEGPVIPRAVRQVLSAGVLDDQGKPETGTIFASR